MLVSDPFLVDANFSRSVILITEYSIEDGTVGFVLNKPTAIELSEVVESFYGNGYLFYIGGPVESDRVFYIHHNDLGITDSLQVTDDLGWSSNFDEAKKLHDAGKLPPKDASNPSIRGSKLNRKRNTRPIATSIRKQG